MLKGKTIIELENVKTGKRCREVSERKKDVICIAGY